MSYSATKQYIDALRRAFVWLVMFALASALLAYAITSTIKPAYEAHFSYLVSLSEREDVSEYRFDGFYALQATDLFAATLARWVQTPEVIVAAHDAADVPVKGDDPRQLSRIVRAQKTAPQLVEVTVRYDNPETVAALVRGLQAVMDENIDQYHDEGIPAVQFRVVTTKPWQGSIRVASGVITLATFVFVLFIGANIVLLVEVFRGQKTNKDNAQKTSQW